MSVFRPINRSSGASYEDEDEYDARNSPQVKKKTSTCKKCCCCAFVLLLLGGAGAGAYFAYVKFLAPKWSESNPSSGSSGEPVSATSGLPTAPSADLAQVCDMQYILDLGTSDCLEACQDGACCFPNGEQNCFDLPGSDIACEPYSPCRDVFFESTTGQDPYYSVGDDKTDMLDTNSTAVPEPVYDGNMTIEEYYPSDTAVKVQGSTDGAGGMPPAEGFQGEIPDVPLYCVSEVGGEIICSTKECTDDQSVCDSNDGEYCASNCSPEGAGTGSAAVAYSICVPADMPDTEVESICQSMSSSMNMASCDATSPVSAGECVCDPSLKDTGCQDDERCTDPVCTITPDASRAYLCYTPTSNNECTMKECSADSDCENGDKCSTDNTCSEDQICCFVEY